MPNTILSCTFIILAGIIKLNFHLNFNKFEVLGNSCRDCRVCKLKKRRTTRDKGELSLLIVTGGSEWNGDSQPVQISPCVIEHTFSVSNQGGEPQDIDIGLGHFIKLDRIQRMRNNKGCMSTWRWRTTLSTNCCILM
jgi:hypothetical protein